MKKIILPMSILMLTSITTFSQWTQKTDFGGTARVFAAGFSIGTKGYIGTGCDASMSPFSDFWEWDQATNIWTQKADFGGTARYFAVGFSIGTMGYIGTGSGNLNDFWEWDGDTASLNYNTWTQKADFGGTGRDEAVGFSIGNKGYIGTGGAGSFYNDFWEWDQATDTWTQKTNLGGTVRGGAVGFSIGNKGYIGTGADDSYNKYKDFWEWDGDTASLNYNTWTQKADFGGTARWQAVGFSVGTKGYIGTGYDVGGIYKKDFWEWEQATNTWTQKVDLSGTARAGGVGFSIGTEGYIGTGWYGPAYKDFWEYSTVVNIPEITNNNGIKIFPNPATDNLEIETSQKSDIEILNVQGELIKSIASTGYKTNIDVSTIPGGIYFIKVKIDKGIIIKKFVKK